MNKFEELAEIIFPEVTKTIADLEMMFPLRNLEEGAYVTRFAPSPTGFLHTGSLFAAMISRKFAVQSNGVFYIRLEDTDQKREIVGSGKSLIEQLATFGVIPSEGYLGDDLEEGKYGPYVQSHRADIYKIVIKDMIKRNLAYACFCSHEELDLLREKQQANKENFGYFGKYAKCSFLSPEEQINKIKNNCPFVIRFRSSGNYENKVEFVDAIRGTISIAQNDQHIVILKSDGLPTYHFAHLVDDHFMRTTHVTRGEEWMASVPIHLELFSSMNWKAPTYCHLPVIMKLDNGNRRKLSKRKDLEAAVSYFLEQGYPVNGFMEYLYTIANSNFEHWRSENKNEPRSSFKMSFDKMSLDGALFDLLKIKNLCKEYLGNMTSNEFFHESFEWSKKYSKELYDLITKDEELYKEIISIEREKVNPRKDYEKYSDIYPLILFYYDDFYYNMKDNNNFDFGNLTNDKIKQFLTMYLNKFDLDKSEEEWFSDMKEVALDCGFAKNPKEFKKNPDQYVGHVGDAASVLRQIISLRTNSPNLYYIMKILGRNKIIERLEKYLNEIA